MGGASNGEVERNGAVATIVGKHGGMGIVVVGACCRYIGADSTLIAAISVADYPGKTGAHSGVKGGICPVVNGEVESNDTVAPVLVYYLCLCSVVAGCIGAGVTWITAVPVAWHPYKSLTGIN